MNQGYFLSGGWAVRVKYETTLEEAKKIKELGYDFSFIDKDFYVNCNWDIDEGFVFSDSLVRITNTGKSERYVRYQVVEFIQPITYYDGTLATVDDDNFHVNLKSMTTTSTYSREGYVHAVYPIIPYPILEACCFRYCTTKSSSYEDFVYCAENYPDKTREKFEELKKEYE